MFIVLLTGVLNVTMVFLLAIKIFDIFYKIELIKKVFIEHEVSPEIAQMLEWKIPSMFFFMGAALYPPLLFYALT
jgi:TRAP-type mannitol/chloroaromatic compound transport system permease small subunit